MSVCKTAFDFTETNNITPSYPPTPKKGDKKKNTKKEEEENKKKLNAMKR